MTNVFGQTNYCHEHGKYKPCERCNDKLIDIGIQIDKNRIAELERQLTLRGDLQGIVRASIHAYNAGKRWEQYEPGYTEHEGMAW